MQQTLDLFFLLNRAQVIKRLLRIRFKDMNTEEADAIIGNEIPPPLNIYVAQTKW
jgi:hypothetical protein